VSKEWLFLGKGQPFTTKKLDQYYADADVEYNHREVDVELNKRVKLVRSGAGLNQTLFANELKVGRDVVTGIENFRSSPSIALAKRIVDKFDVNPMWLIYGQGSMRK
jgi:DNA-binding XRE family transcriptional regulator